jgi:hypothetical protein
LGSEWHPPHLAPVTCITENDFIARAERLITELGGRSAADADLVGRRHEMLTEGYGRALALEGQRRRLRERQLELADLSEPDAGALRELTTLARREARLGRREHELRALLSALKGAHTGPLKTSRHEMMPRRSA